MLNDVQNGEFNRYLDLEATDIYINHIDTFLNCVNTFLHLFNVLSNRNINKHLYHVWYLERREMVRLARWRGLVTGYRESNMGLLR